MSAINFLFLFSSLGVINGIIVGSYLLLRRERTVSDTYFAGLIFMLCIRIGKSVIHYFFQDTDRLLLQFGLSACTFIGPFFYLYIKSLRQNQKKVSRSDVLLLLIVLLAVLLVGSLYPYRIYPDYWNPKIVQGIYLIWGFFTVLAIFQAYKLLGNQLFSFWKLKGERQYLMVILVGVLFITCTYELALYIGFTYLWGSFIFSILFYILAFRALSKGMSVTPKITIRKLAKGDQMLEQINRLMKDKKLYTKQDLKLEDIGKEIGLSRHEVSQVLNSHYTHGYTHYIKSLRVDEAKTLIATRPELSLEGIGYEAGFRSKSSFFDAFKKVTNLTPATYKKQLTKPG